MALTSIPGGMWIPGIYGYQYPVYSSLLIDAADEKAGAIVQVPKTGTITKIGFRTSTVTAGATVDVRAESVSAATGHPSGTLLSANSNGAQVINDTDDNTWFTTALTSGAAVTQGDEIALVVSNPSVSFGNMQITAMYAAHWAAVQYTQFPYSVAYVGGAWSKSTLRPLMIFEYSDGSYADAGVSAYSAITATAYRSNISPNHRGIRFSLPFPCRIRGLSLAGFDHNGTDGDVLIKFVDSDGATMTTVKSLDYNVNYMASSKSSIEILFTASQTIAKDTFYRIVIAPTSTSFSSFIYVGDVASVAAMDSIAGGQNFHYTTAHNPTQESDWTNFTTKKLIGSLLIDQFDDGASGGGPTASVSPSIDLGGGLNKLIIASKLSIKT